MPTIKEGVYRRRQSPRLTERSESPQPETHEATNSNATADTTEVISSDAPPDETEATSSDATSNTSEATNGDTPPDTTETTSSDATPDTTIPSTQAISHEVHKLRHILKTFYADLQNLFPFLSSQEGIVEFVFTIS
ncbi:uncharacterized protein N7515_005706 [Penicillium bovifimosum]|uniref:Uncharacterized protein n=1 Tax=Penicillium bovifimosum TaxID=126998 RepID=A0A9W9GTH1_9EURO|nr:uncharacterized protein N7515_005706 [Penicillium bovifimosum]KAJ5129667.1 hypothetical protein N7515_005706 [Penicillium bovifimosum]